MGLHVPTYTLWIVFILSHCIRVEEYYSARAQMSSSSTLDTDDEAAMFERAIAAEGDEGDEPVQAKPDGGDEPVQAKPDGGDEPVQAKPDDF